MRSILNDDDRAAITSRLRSLSGASTARWGSMDVAHMLRHLRLSAQMATGELSVVSKNKRPLQVFPLKHLLLYVLPFPKGAPTAPELKQSTARSVEGGLSAEGGSSAEVAPSFDEELAGLVELLERIGTGARDGGGPDHPLFGPLTRREWGVATYKHTDHHLKQFGA
jgi:hypothetical protein